MSSSGTKEAKKKSQQKRRREEEEDSKEQSPPPTKSTEPPAPPSQHKDQPNAKKHAPEVKPAGRMNQEEDIYALEEDQGEALMPEEDPQKQLDQTGDSFEFVRDDESLDTPKIGTISLDHIDRESMEKELEMHLLVRARNLEGESSSLMKNFNQQSIGDEHYDMISRYPTNVDNLNKIPEWKGVDTFMEAWAVGVSRMTTHNPNLPFKKFLGEDVIVIAPPLFFLIDDKASVEDLKEFVNSSKFLQPNLPATTVPDSGSLFLSVRRESPLYRAVSKGTLEQVKFLCGLPRIDPNCGICSIAGEFSMNPLQAAIMKRDVGMVNALLDTEGIDPNVGGFVGPEMVPALVIASEVWLESSKNGTVNGDSDALAIFRALASDINTNVDWDFRLDTSVRNSVASYPVLKQILDAVPVKI